MPLPIPCTAKTLFLMVTQHDLGSLEFADPIDYTHARERSRAASCLPRFFGFVLAAGSRAEGSTRLVLTPLNISYTTTCTDQPLECMYVVRALHKRPHKVWIGWEVEPSCLSVCLSCTTECSAAPETMLIATSQAMKRVAVALLPHL